MNRLRRLAFCSIMLACLSATALAAESWKPAESPLLSKWADQITQDNVWTEYPRPQMVREDWVCLNGLWDFAVIGEDREWDAGRVENAIYDPLLKDLPSQPAQWTEQILVPFSPETALSGVGRLIRPHQLLWYHRIFTVPSDWTGKRIRLNFEAVDWHAIVLVNGQKVADNRGGYVPFSCDITDALKPQGEQELTLVAWDPTNMGDQTIGKQALPELRKGFRYTPNSGIWQTVWMEPVDRLSIDRLTIVPDIDQATVRVTTLAHGGAEGAKVRLAVLDAGHQIASITGTVGETLDIPFAAAAKLWTPDRPFLYDLEATLVDSQGKTLDQVTSYFGMRKVSIGRDPSGVLRFLVNNRPLFQFGPLDQGYWPDGALTPSCDEAAKFDVQYLKDIGCNMVRVHIKIHPARWYHYCDKLGLLVWQDFICSRKFDTNITDASAAQWELEQRRMIDHLGNHPSIAQWIVFNEGWGQYDTERLTAWTKQYDPSRPVTGASGWTDYPVGDIFDNHDYSFSPSTAMAISAPDRAVLLGECGGHNVYTKDHVWFPDRVQGPQVDPIADGGRETYADGAQWLSRYKPWLMQLRLLQEYGLNGAVYTQISDVEHECNGWLTYDRSVSKVDPAVLFDLHQRLYRPTKSLPILPTRLTDPVKYQTGEVPENWTDADFDDAAWQSGDIHATDMADLALTLPEAGKGTAVHVRVPFVLGQLTHGPYAMRIAGTGRYDVYLNGVLIKTLINTLRTEHTPVSAFVLHDEAVALLNPEDNVLAIKITPAGKRGAMAPGRCVGFELVEVVE